MLKYNPYRYITYKKGVISDMETKKIIEEYLDKNKDKLIDTYYLTSEEIYNCEEEFDKSLLEFDDSEILMMFSRIVVSNNQVLQNSLSSALRNRYNTFFKWCIKMGYAKENQFVKYKDELSDKSILSYLVYCNGDGLVLYKPDEIESMCQKINLIDDGIYFEGIIRTFYEGMPSTMTFVKMKESYINWNTNIIDFGYMKFKISDRLKYIYKYVSNMDNLVLKGSIRKKTYRLERYNGSLYKFTIRDKSKWENNNHVDVNVYAVAKGINSSRFSFLEKYLECKLTPEILYNSWLFKVLLENSGNDSNHVSDLILGKNAKVKCKLINSYFENIEQGVLSGNEIRRRLRPYFIKIQNDKPL